MKGVKGYIRENIPKSWEHVLLQKKCIGSFVEQFYQAIAKKKNRNRYHYKVTIMNARHYLKTCSIDSIAIAFEFKEGVNFWNEIGYLVKQYDLTYK